MAKHQGLVHPRKTPSQTRSRRTVDLILEASAQLLASGGEEALTTSRIADRAGFSIGTLYQYFPNRDSILDVLIERERENSDRRIRIALAEIDRSEIKDTIRAIVRILIESFTSHGRMRKRFSVSMMRLAMARGGQVRLDLIAGNILEVWRNSGVRVNSDLNESEAFVLTRAALGVLRAAVLEDSPLLKTAAFEDAMVRLVLGFLGIPAGS